MDGPEELERKLRDMLTEGEIQTDDGKERERMNLASKYEVRIQTQLDPIVEHTLKYRSMAKELDGRYDEYMGRAQRSKPADERESK
ncbi:hypothetical protein OIN60_16215 [Paenibacillus sp. P96]|uniref:Uncharacterized protein n=1 Tax=Paenibacillus zeirhizosphaerae TaxID=2987519 RepID=A0ABT9FU78_9BACL|nr:hypothetical protein [Paenibacillus sp. P96]MDP4098302.1 hypothetical protein [Paenibacillus sp. P96]